jgi:hypothetical protein
MPGATEFLWGLDDEENAAKAAGAERLLAGEVVVEGGEMTAYDFDLLAEIQTVVELRGKNLSEGSPWKAACVEFAKAAARTLDRHTGTGEPAPPVTLDLAGEDRTYIASLASFRVMLIWDPVDLGNPDAPPKETTKAGREAAPFIALIDLVEGGGTLEGRILDDCRALYEALRSLLYEEKNRCDGFAGSFRRDLRMLEAGKSNHRYAAELREADDPAKFKGKLAEDYREEMENYTARADRAAELLSRVKDFGSALHVRYCASCSQERGQDR